MAQWTADRWAEFGFTSRLDEYCKLTISFSVETTTLPIAIDRKPHGDG
jgi:hypothetical protein